MQQITSSPPGAGLEGESLSRDPPPSPTGRVVLAPISEAEAAAVARWRYPPPDDLYDGSDTGREAMLDPANGYQSVHVGAEFVGFVCAGPDARVAGQTETAGVQDIGWGFRPDLVGQRLASGWAVHAVEILTRQTSAHHQRVTVASWNQRSLALARRLGFAHPTPHINDSGHWTVLTRPLSGGERSHANDARRALRLRANQRSGGS